MKRAPHTGSSRTATVRAMARWALLIGLASGCTPTGGGDGDGQDTGPPDLGGPGQDAGPDEGPVDGGGLLDEGPDGAMPDAMAGHITLENHPEDCAPTAIVGAFLPDELGHWAAERLEPPSTPFLVDTIEYHLSGPTADTAQCATGVPHRVFVVSAPGAGPPASPAALESYRTFDVSPPEAASWVSELELDPPLVVGAGEALFVGVEAGTAVAGTQLCIVICPDPVPGVSFWSNSATAPYPWADLLDFDIWNLSIRAHGVEGG